MAEYLCLFDKCCSYDRLRNVRWSGRILKKLCIFVVLLSTTILLAFFALHFETTKPTNTSLSVDATCEFDIKEWGLLGMDVTVNNEGEISNFIKVRCSNVKYHKCTSPEAGAMEVNVDHIELDTLFKTELDFVKRGGLWSPGDCTVTEATAIVIPFRNRHQQLPILMRQLHPLLKQQQLAYRIFVIEQDDESPINRGKLRNVGFMEALKLFPYSCFVFHDVDLIPEDGRINYGCRDSPSHLSVAINKFNYTLPYLQIFGGVQMLRPSDYRKINGFSNQFYEWGGEDDNFYHRTVAVRLKVHRQSPNIARYTMLRHTHNFNWTEETGRHVKRVMGSALRHRARDGLSSVQYKVNEIVMEDLFTMIKVDLQREKELRF